MLNKQIKKNGLSDSYALFFEHILNQMEDSIGGEESYYDGNAPLLLRKNIAFWNCCRDWIKKQSDLYTNQNEVGDSFHSNSTSDNADNNTKWSVTPLWYMDSTKRDLNHKNAYKYNSMVYTGFTKINK